MSLLRLMRVYPIRTIMVVVLIVAYYFALPNPLFKDPSSNVMYSSTGELLGAKIAKDGQWRFPEIDSIPYKYKSCLLAFEDRHFYSHWGFNPIAISKALYENIKKGRIVRGGSTITQQVIRMSRKGKSRTYFEKIIELILATRLEFSVSKDEILYLYASHAPFGGNVVGLDMAAWRYFGIAPDQLSWAESATLAVLPNAPSLIYPGKNQNLLRQKRNRVLETLLEQKTIDSLTYRLAIQEPLPSKPYLLPQLAPHLLQQLGKKYPDKSLHTTIDIQLQKQVNGIVKQHYELLKQNEVYNMAVLVLDVESRDVLAYVGNTPTDIHHQKDVDIVQANRSTGSTLKPLLYAALLDKGELLPTELVPDIPTVIAGYTPENYDESYRGAVAADLALARSLNVPAVLLLRKYGLQRFREELENFRIKGIQYSADHYGLSLIVGGAEGSLWDLCKTYAGFAGTLNHFQSTSSEYFKNEFTEPNLLKTLKVDFGKKEAQKSIFSAGSIWLTLEAMKKANRPEGDEAWQFYDSSREIGWKTGTSFGNRDAWAIGTSKKHVVGVWIGNADGEGRPELTGLNAAAPVLFDVFNLLPRSDWFEPPYDDLQKIKVCAESGYRSGIHCPVKEQFRPVSGVNTKPCPFHKRLNLDAQGKYRVNSSCDQVSEMLHQSWFVLPPLQGYYYKNNNPSYRPLPPFRKDCIKTNESKMDFIFPKQHGVVHLPVGFDGKVNEVVLKIAHSKPQANIFWYLNSEYLGTTDTFHEIGIRPKPGKYVITAIDEQGNEIKRNLEIRK